MGRRAPIRGVGRQAATPPLPNKNFKKKDFVDTKISMVSRDSPFSDNQTLKSAEDRYTEIKHRKFYTNFKQARTLGLVI